MRGGLLTFFELHVLVEMADSAVRETHRLFIS